MVINLLQSNINYANYIVTSYESAFSFNESAFSSNEWIFRMLFMSDKTHAFQQPVGLNLHHANR